MDPMMLFGKYLMSVGAAQQFYEHDQARIDEPIDALVNDLAQRLEISNELAAIVVAIGVMKKITKTFNEKLGELGGHE